MEKTSEINPVVNPSPDDSIHEHADNIINASGHKQELDRNFGLLSICSVGIVTGNEWAAFGVSVILALYNGGPPGVIYELLVSTFFYCFVYASIAELASSLPSSAGVYHWASVAAGPRYGKSVGFFAGWWNFLAWMVGAASMALNTANITISMWAIYHEDYVFHRWHVFIIYLIASLLCSGVVAFCNRALPGISQFGLMFIIAGFLVSLLICAIMPHTNGSGYASSSFVWKDWTNETGYSSNGFVFLAGMLNGAYAVGTPDVTSHLSEEIPNPRVNVPKAMLAQIVIGTITVLGYMIALFYSVSDLPAVFKMTAELPFPVAAIYQQATSSQGASIGLLVVILLPIVCTTIGAYLTACRILWTLARDNATPFPGHVGRISPWGKNPMNSAIVCFGMTTALGLIYIGSLTAFNAITASFVLLSTLSYVAAIGSNFITRRKYLQPGPFHLKGLWRTIVPLVASAYIVTFIVIFCFPFTPHVTAANMNYSVLITGGFTIFIGLLYLWKRSRGYEGPLIMQESVRNVVAEAETKHGEVFS